MQERKDKIAHLLASGSAMTNIGVDQAFYGESVGRYGEIDDYLGMQYDDLKGA